MIVCHCTGVSDAMIRQMVRDGAQSAADIGQRSGAGLCCLPCRREIATLVNDTRTAYQSASTGCSAVAEG
jgi:bacterioferritin-associated ferredoxin